MDVQNDFCAGGALAVGGADEIIPFLNVVIQAFAHASLPVFFTRDWHPRGHMSFAERGGRWPPHCIQGTHGADLHPRLVLPNGAVVIDKGTAADFEAYSGFQGTDLERRLRDEKVEGVYVGGLATDYCVKQTAIDAVAAGFKVWVMRDCVRAVGLSPGDVEAALQKMADGGVRFATSQQVVSSMGR